VSQSWNTRRSALTLQLAGIAGSNYGLAMRNPSQVASVEGGEVVKLPNGAASLQVSFPASDRSGYENSVVVIHFISEPAALTVAQ
jgi:hypothetical protein